MIQPIPLSDDEDESIDKNHADQEVGPRVGKGTQRTQWKEVAKEDTEREIPEWKGSILTPEKVQEPIEYFCDLSMKSLSKHCETNESICSAAEPEQTSECGHRRTRAAS